MALIGKIRQNGWILVVFLGLALFGFIIQDALQNKSNYAAGDVNTIGRVEGVSISRSAFDNYQSLVYSNSTADPYQVRTQVFNYFVEDALVKKAAEAVGLGVPKDELLDLQFGTNLSPIIQQRFANEAGQVQMAQLTQIKQAIEGKQLPAEYRSYWAVQEDEIIKERLQSKYSSMIAKAVYTPKWQAEMGFQENNLRYNFSYVRVPYDKVDPSEIKLTDADYEAYLSENKEQYYQNEETRLMELVAIDVVPTAQDSVESLKKVSDALAKWASVSSDSVFIVQNNGTWNGAFRTKAELSPALGDTLSKTATGTVIGPWLADGAYTIAKVVARKAVPDSVRARHILIKPDQIGPAAAEKLVDSLLEVLTAKRTSFDSLAARFGTDATSTKGGDLDWFGPGSMVKEFNDAAFYQLDQGKPAKVQTQFGWHVIEVTGKKFTTNQSGMQVATLTERVRPGKSTQNNFRAKAEELASSCKTVEQLRDAAQKAGIQLATAPPVRENDFQVGATASGQEARDILRWAFDEKTKVGNVSKQIFTIADQTGGYYDRQYVVGGLKSIRPKGYAKVADVKEQIETQVANRKRAQILTSKIQNAGNLEAVASQFGLSVEGGTNVNFMSPSIGQGGFEPKVVGRALGMKDGEVSKPIAGNSGVYIVSGGKLANEMETPGDLSMFRKQLASGMSGQVRSRLFSIMKKTADIEDFRSRFF
jgi:peptidyl-prolyl cis-trans isomerase D